MTHGRGEHQDGDLITLNGDFVDRAKLQAEAEAAAVRIINDLQWLVFRRPDQIATVEITTQRLRSDIAPVIPPFAPPLRLSELPDDPLRLAYPPSPRLTRDGKPMMAHARLSYDQRAARMSPAQRVVIDAIFNLVTAISGRPTSQ